MTSFPMSYSLIPTFRISMLFSVATLAPLASAQDFMLAPGSSTHGLTGSNGGPPLNLGAFDIVISPDAGLAGNAPALAAFNRAAAQWEGYISDPITVTISAGLAALANPNTIGSTSSVDLQGSYNTIRNAMVADAANEADDAIAAFLPTAAQFSGNVSSGDAFNGNMSATKAALKALGFTGLDTNFGVSDGSITFNSTFAFDYDNSNGITPGMMDFETVAAHEIGHALGFVSAVDVADNTIDNLTLQPTPLDLFRFSDSNDPTTNAEFTNKPRNFVPGQSAVFDDVSNEWRMSTGINGGSDAQQASHWLDNNGIGIMDPTLSIGELSHITTADLRAFDLIGYEIVTVPEPSALLLGALGGSFLLRRRRSA
jgi:hypothetical protein